MKTLITTSLFFIFLINLIGAHVCDDVLRDDPIKIRAEKQILRIIEQDQFKIFLKNNYHYSIHDVKIIAPEKFDISVNPELIKEVKSGEEVYFLVNIKIPEGIRAGRYPLVMKVNALEFEAMREVSITIEVKKEEAALEIIPIIPPPEEVPLAPIEIKPEMEAVKVNETKSLKIFLKNNHHSDIHKVRLILPENMFNITINPDLIEKIKPNQEVYFLVNIKIPEGIRAGRYPLVMKVNALEFDHAGNVSIIIEIERGEAIAEIIPPEEIPVAISVFPSMIEIEPGQKEEFRVFIRNGYSKSLHNLTLFINESRFNLSLNPKVREELKPGDRTYFWVNLTVPEGMKYGDYMLIIELSADEFAVGRRVFARIKVQKVKEEITYLYLLIILFFLLILSWRKFHLRSKQHQKQ